ncbi:hypothetical protein Btru_068919 [Bulinus truncatus]|nr:hypothetical protein Btru_068919 [Bulinus truncatus]
MNNQLHFLFNDVIFGDSEADVARQTWQEFSDANCRPPQHLHSVVTDGQERKLLAMRNLGNDLSVDNTPLGEGSLSLQEIEVKLQPLVDTIASTLPLTLFTPTEYHNSNISGDFLRPRTMNVTSSPGVEADEEEDSLTKAEIPIIVLYTVLCVVAVLGNSLTVYVVVSKRRMRNVTNYFIASLAVSDVLMAIVCIPFTFVANILLQYWPFGSIMCPVVTYLQVAIVFQNAYTLLAMSLERYIAIMHPFMRRLGKRRCLEVVALCWVLAFLTPVPTAITSNLSLPENSTNVTREVCLEKWESKQKQFTYSVTIMVLQYFVPLAVLIYTYAQIVRVIWLKDLPTPAELIHQNGKDDNDRINRHQREPDPRKKVSTSPLGHFRGLQFGPCVSYKFTVGMYP